MLFTDFKLGIWLKDNRKKFGQKSWMNKMIIAKLLWNKLFLMLYLNLRMWKKSP